jgi:hypothetical protein
MIDCKTLTERQKLIVVLHELGHLKILIEEMLEVEPPWHLAKDMALNPHLND